MPLFTFPFSTLPLFLLSCWSVTSMSSFSSPPLFSVPALDRGAIYSSVFSCDSHPGLSQEEGSRKEGLNISGVQGGQGTWCSPWAGPEEAIRSPWVINRGLRKRRRTMSSRLWEKTGRSSGWRPCFYLSLIGPKELQMQLKRVSKLNEELAEQNQNLTLDDLSEVTFCFPIRGVK